MDKLFENSKNLSIEHYKLNVKVLLLRKLFQLLSEKVVKQSAVVHKPVGSCEVCGRRAELEKVRGYNFKMCPHCAYMTRVHAKESHDAFAS